MSRVLIVCVIFALVPGCAGYRLTPMTPEGANEAHTRPDREGYIFNAPAPFLIGSRVVKDGVSTYDFKIVYLPDYKRPYRFTRYEFLAQSSLDITFQEGWRFDGAKSTSDSTATVAALAEVAGSILAMREAEAAPADLVIFRINPSERPALQQVYP
jgi:hypothetical protein